MRDGVEHPTSFVEASQKRRSSMEMSNNISERRFELKANEPVSERSERASGYATDLLVRRRSRVTGKSGVYYIIHVSIVSFHD